MLKGGGVRFPYLRWSRIMRHLVLLLLLLAASWADAGPPVILDAGLREEPSPYAHLNLTVAQLAAAQELELAQFRLLSWWNYELPQRLRKLDADLAVAQEELGSLQRRQAEN